MYNSDSPCLPGQREKGDQLPWTGPPAMEVVAEDWNGIGQVVLRAPRGASARVLYLNHCKSR